MSSVNENTSHLPSEDGGASKVATTSTEDERKQPPPSAAATENNSHDTTNNSKGDNDDAKNDDNNNDDNDNNNNDDSCWEVQRDTAKASGDAAFRTHDYATAIEHYTTALSLDPDNATLLSNRSAAYLKHHQKSLALYDAQACCRIGSMGVKGIGRLAAALQALGRFQLALDEYNKILQTDATNAAAKKGAQDCRIALQNIKRDQDEEQETTPQQTKEEEEDDLDDFFNDVEEAAEQVVKAKQEEAQDGSNNNNTATDAIKNHKKDLGTTKEQIARLLADNYQWRNLNPFFVLDISHDASKDDISRRYKALSLLLHPDKNRNETKAQDAYDEVLKAKAILDDEHKASHARQLIEQGLKHGKADFEKHCAMNMNTSARQKLGKKRNDDAELQLLLQDFQSKAVQRIFAQVEHKRREVERRERNQQQREQQQEQEELDKQKKSRKFDQDWKQEERVDERIGNWRDFQQDKSTKKTRKT